MPRKQLLGRHVLAKLPNSFISAKNANKNLFHSLILCDTSNRLSPSLCRANSKINLNTLLTPYTLFSGVNRCVVRAIVLAFFSLDRKIEFLRGNNDCFSIKNSSFSIEIDFLIKRIWFLRNFFDKKSGISFLSSNRSLLIVITTKHISLKICSNQMRMPVCHSKKYNLWFFVRDSTNLVVDELYHHYKSAKLYRYLSRLFRW